MHQAIDFALHTQDGHESTKILYTRNSAIVNLVLYRLIVQYLLWCPVSSAPPFVPVMLIVPVVPVSVARALSAMLLLFWPVRSRAAELVLENVIIVPFRRARP